MEGYTTQRRVKKVESARGQGDEGQREANDKGSGETWFTLLAASFMNASALALSPLAPPYKGGVAEREHPCLPSGNAEDPDSQKVILDKCVSGPLNRLSGRDPRRRRALALEEIRHDLPSGIMAPRAVASWSRSRCPMTREPGAASWEETC